MVPPRGNQGDRGRAPVRDYPRRLASILCRSLTLPYRLCTNLKVPHFPYYSSDCQAVWFLLTGPLICNFSTSERMRCQLSYWTAKGNHGRFPWEGP
jgi:hypothetical protein